jgi:predicted nucleic acid-binding protein
MKVFVDVNVVMYAAGAAHPYQAPSQRLLQRIAQRRDDLDAVIDAAILQELLYRFWHRRVVEHGVTLVRQLVQVIPTILPVRNTDMVAASEMLLQHPEIEPHDAIHAAIMLTHGIAQLYSYDRHFDLIPGLTRLEP